MTQYSAPWDGSTTGDATEAPYDAPTEWAEYWSSLGGQQFIGSNIAGVVAGSLNMLRPSISGANALIATGRAFVDGTFFKSDATEAFALSTPVSATRIDRIVARKNWTDQTIRLTHLSGIEGGSAPALEHTGGDLWDLPIGKYTITTGGVITLVDEREWTGLSTYRPCCALDRDAPYTLSTSSPNGAAIPFNVERYDPFLMHESVTNPSRVTIGLPGTYKITIFNPNYIYGGSAPAQTDVLNMHIWKNGAVLSPTFNNEPRVYNNTGPVYHFPAFNIVYYADLLQDDYIEIYGYTSLANLQIYTANGWLLTVEYVGPTTLVHS